MPSVGGADSGAFGSVDNALRILMLFNSHATVRIADAAAELGIAKSTAHRILTMLEYRGFVQQETASRAYGLGPAILEAGLLAISSSNLRSTARRHLEALRDETSESCGFLVREGSDVVLLEFVEADTPLRVIENVGDRQPAHLTAAGKVLLAYLDEPSLDGLYPDTTLQAWTDASVSSRAELDRVLTEVRRLGIATNLEESGLGVVGIATAVRDLRGQVIGALTVALPASRLGEDLEATLGPPLRRAAELMGADVY